MLVLVLREELLSVVGLLVVLTYNHQFCQVIPPSPSASPRGRGLSRHSRLAVSGACCKSSANQNKFCTKSKRNKQPTQQQQIYLLPYSSQHHQAATTALERFCARRFRDSFFGLLLSSSSSDLRTFWSFSDSTISMWQGLDMYGLVRPWAR